ncbi:MAG: hypothetical protein EA425_14680 [Puniceicoccaceae bacterium]|nr:MAG: hypothetical protein EA425_14680 [Puniceicoccaceae bacterium]
MKTRLPVTLLLTAFAVILALPPVVHGQNNRRVIDTAAQEALLERAEALIARKEIRPAEALAALIDPYFPRYQKAEEEKPSQPRGPSEMEILTAASAQIRPSGSVTLSGSDFLLLGEKRLRQGDVLTIEYLNQKYPITIAKFDSRSVTLRFNQQEITRNYR